MAKRYATTASSAVTAAVPGAWLRSRTFWGAYGERKASERGISCRILAWMAL